MIHNSEQTRKFMDNIKDANFKFKVDEDIEKRLLKEYNIKEDSTDNANDTFYVGNVSVFFDNTLKGGYFHVHLESKNGKKLSLKYGTEFGEDTVIKMLQFLSENN